MRRSGRQTRKKRMVKLGRAVKKRVMKRLRVWMTKTLSKVRLAMKRNKMT